MDFQVLNWETKLFLTADNLTRQLDQLQEEGETSMVQTEKPHDPHHTRDIVQVTDLSPKKLTIKINKDAKTSISEEEEDQFSEDDCPSSADIEVVHSKATPPLHGILKQRSFSESSESSAGDSPTSLSPREDGSKRSVHFNSHVDRTTFKSNSTVTSMKVTLKSKRRRNRKKEEKKERCSRRRHNSTGSECSSCDDDHDVKNSGESHSEDDHDGLADQISETEKKIKSYGIINEDDEKSEASKQSEEAEKGEEIGKASSESGYKIQSKSGKPKVKMTSKIADEVKSKMAETKDKEDDSDDDEEDEVGQGADVGDTKDQYKNQKDVDRTSKNEMEISGAGGSGPSEKSKSDPAGDSEAAISHSSGEPNTSGKSGAMLSESVKDSGKQENGKSERGNGDGGVDDSQASVDVKNDVETELSWREADRNAENNEHKTSCAFKFSNDVMFDLDID